MLAEEVQISIEKTPLEGFLTIPLQAKGLVLFVHGSGSSRHSPRNQLVARFLQENQIATLLFDLLTASEEQKQDLRFDIPFLTKRLLLVTQWAEKFSPTHSLTKGYFGASTGAAAALCAAAHNPGIRAIVSRGGRPDLAGNDLSKVLAPTLLIVGGNDFGVIELNEKAFALLPCPKKLEIVPQATHLFEEPGTLEEVGRMAALWFQEYL